MHEHALGALLLQHPMMREEDLERCLSIQQLTGGTRPLGQVLLDEGILTERALNQLLALHNEPRVPVATIDGAVADDPVALLNAALAAAANELVVSTGKPAFVRIGGELRPFTATALTEADVRRFLEAHIGGNVADLLRRNRSFTRDLTIAGRGRGRLDVFRHLEGIGVTVRLHPAAPRAAVEAGLVPEVLATLQEKKGLFLVAGEARSGVSETLGAVLAQLVAERDRLILVLDENLEFADPGGEAVVVRRRVGHHTANYCTGLRTAIGLDPDVLVVGDACDPAVFDLCLRAAEAGRLVVTAVRTRSVVAALERVLSYYAPRDVARVRATLAAVLRCVMAIQVLPDAERRGQVMAIEVLRPDDAVREVIRDGTLRQLHLLMRLEATSCGQSMDASLLALLRARRIRSEDAFARAEDKTLVLNATREVP